MVVKGVSTRKVAEVAEELFGREIPKSTVSRMCESLDPIVNEFRERPLAPHIPFIIVDAIYIKLREGERVVSKALYIATGINADGFREVLGFTLANAESKALYKEFFCGLRERGLERVGLVVSDSHTGLREAIRESFPGASWQRCQTHFSRNMLDATPKKLWPEMKETLREIYTAPDVQIARARKDAAVLAYEKLAPKAAALLDDSFDDIAAVFALPTTYRKRLRTSNGIERLNEEVRRRERPIRIFPSEGSVMRILGTVLMEAHEKWVSGKRYFNMDEYLRQGEKTPAAGDCQKEVA
jgi:transposase-like protein